ncbi:immunoglobulin superfamily member 3 isoform X1 [Oreochromis niloticus]|uniref:immunoglobulin superfamily member 3 isoform X1 n=1 Tax=Oreochromis niloticus TaxID=8128 RepID=UPI000905A64B|nr:immunoglobulin superfamily member 3 isoform X1 [Oreochromis niloticus]
MMSCFLLSVWRSSLILCLGQLLRCGEARVKTEVQAGPLYRVLGSPLYITCSVSGFRSENTDKHFEFRMTTPSNPNRDIQIISSKDDDFGYSNHLIRVRKNEIALKRLSPNSVRFEIKSLLKADEGEYECTAVNLEGAYDGEYSAKTVVKVIEDSLSVSSSASTPLSLNEGEALTLTCLASSSTSQHTHLSVAWYLHKDGQEDAQPIISLNRDFTLSPGQGFERRYQAGLIRLDKLGEAAYNLQMAKVEPSDQGRIYCQAQEWIQDPDGSWYIIIQKNAEEMTLTVKATEVVDPSSPSLAVEISAQPAALQEGQELLLSCNINTQDVEKRFFSVAWLKGRVELARIGPTGVLTVAPEYSVRQKNGELRAARSGNRDYRLILKPVRTEDQGEYICRVWPQERGQDDAFIEGEAKDSTPQRVNISATENRLTVKMQQAVNVAEGGGLHLSCKVDGVQGQLSVTWEQKSASMASFTKIISINQEGVTEIAEEFMSRKVRVMRPTTHNFTLELDEVTLSDSGVYQCAVSDRKPNGKTHSQTQTTTVTVISIENRLSVKMQQAGNVAEGGGLHLSCKVDGVQGQLSVTWEQKSASMASFTKIISINEEGVTEIAEEFMSRKVRVMRPTTDNFTLELDEVTLSDSGVYQCAVSERKPNGKTHNQAQTTTVTVTSIENRLSIKMQQAENVTEGGGLHLSCKVDGVQGQLSVTWQLKSARMASFTEIISISQEGVTEIAEEFVSRKVRVMRPATHNFTLELDEVTLSDSGVYQCAVSEHKPNGKTHSQTQTTTVTVISIENRLSVKMQQAVNVAEGGGLHLSCKVDGVQGQLSVTWQLKSARMASFTDIISISQEGVTEIAEEFVSRTVRVMRPATHNFTLELDEVTLSDSGVYQCAVSERKPNSKTHNQTQTTTVTVISIDTLMGVSLISRKSRVTVGEKLELMCRVRGPHMPVTVTWSVQREAKTPDTILTLSPNGTISWSADQNHYQLRVESRKTEVIYYLLVIGTSHREGGNYQCNVSVLLKNVHKELKASNQLAVIVNNPVSRLDVSPIPALTRNMNTDITITCSIVTKTSESSLYSITWLHEENAGIKTIVSLDRNSIVMESKVDLGQRISMRRSKGPTFELTIRQARISDNGSYTCKVGEWLQDPRGEWYLLSTVSKSTVLTITEPAPNLRLDKKEQQLTAKEGEEVELNCNITSGASGSSVFYGVIWRYAAHSSSLKNASLVELDHTGLVSYPDNKDMRGLQERLRLSRPTQKSFYLSIQKAHEEDSGTYWCQVDQHQLDHEAHWQLKASDSGGAIKLSVKVTENNLSIPKEEAEMNTSRNQDLTIPCNINKQSSHESKFQVTWFWQKEIETKQRPIFTVYRNSTLQDRFGENVRLKYDHPDPSQFSLTFLNPGPENSGLYFCEVEEWLPSLSRGWRKVAVEKSGHFNVSVLTEGDANADSECNTRTYIIIAIVILIVLVLVLLLLVVTMCRSKGSLGNKSGPSLWGESVPMNTSRSGDD